MGHASQIALGVAQQTPDRRVICLDGDGAVLMHMGSLAIIGTQAPTNLLHVVINNAAHDSVGGQPTAADRVRIPDIAVACGYTAVETTANAADLERALDRLASRPGPCLLEVRTASHARTDAGRPTTSPVENKRAFMEALKRGR
jgi:phosphonopyruvate decarboxylase